MIEQHTPSDNFEDDPERIVTSAPLFDDYAPKSWAILLDKPPLKKT
jgi:hypothetical protein